MQWKQLRYNSRASLGLYTSQNPPQLNIAATMYPISSLISVFHINENMPDYSDVIQIQFKSFQVSSDSTQCPELQFQYILQFFYNQHSPHMISLLRMGT